MLIVWCWFIEWSIITRFMDMMLIRFGTNFLFLKMILPQSIADSAQFNQYHSLCLGRGHLSAFAAGSNPDGWRSLHDPRVDRQPKALLDTCRIKWGMQLVARNQLLRARLMRLDVSNSDRRIKLRSFLEARWTVDRKTRTKFRSL